MAETAALVPVPFYAPVLTGAGSFLNDGDAPRRAMALVPPPRIAAAGPVEGVAYSRQGRVIGDRCIGTRVDIYA